MTDHNLETRAFSNPKITLFFCFWPPGAFRRFRGNRRRTRSSRNRPRTVLDAPGRPVARFRGPPGGRFGVARALENHRFTAVKRRFRPFGRSRCLWAPKRKKTRCARSAFSPFGPFRAPLNFTCPPGKSRIRSLFSPRVEKRGSKNRPPKKVENKTRFRGCSAQCAVLPGGKEG